MKVIRHQHVGEYAKLNVLFYGFKNFDATRFNANSFKWSEFNKKIHITTEFGVILKYQNASLKYNTISALCDEYNLNGCLRNLHQKLSLSCICDYNKFNNALKKVDSMGNYPPIFSEFTKLKILFYGLGYKPPDQIFNSNEFKWETIHHYIESELSIEGSLLDGSEYVQHLSTG